MITVIGTSFADIKGYPLGKYLHGGRNAGDVNYVHGGVARNIAENIANIGLKTAFVSTVDHSGVGLSLVNHLKETGVETAFIKAAENGLGTWLAVFDETGDVVAQISKRPDLSEIVNTLKASGDELFEKSSAICLEIDMEEPIIKETMKLAEKHKKDVYGVISNMTIGLERKKYIQKLKCFVCNQMEMGIFFGSDYSNNSPADLSKLLLEKIKEEDLESMVVTLGEQGAIYADARTGICGCVEALKVDVVDTTGAGDAFFTGVSIGLSSGKSLKDACILGTKIASEVIQNTQNVCPVMEIHI